MKIHWEMCNIDFHDVNFSFFYFWNPKNFQKFSKHIFLNSTWNLTFFIKFLKDFCDFWSIYRTKYDFFVNAYVVWIDCGACSKSGTVSSPRFRIFPESHLLVESFMKFLAPGSVCGFQEKTLMCRIFEFLSHFVWFNFESWKNPYMS